MKFVGYSDETKMEVRLTQGLLEGKKRCQVVVEKNNLVLGLGNQKGPPPYGQRLLSG